MADLSIDYTQGSANYGDLLWVDGDLVLTSDSDSRGTNVVLQNINQALKSFQGEWFLNLSEGVPWIQTILRKGCTKAERESILQDVLTQVDGVSQLNALTTSVNTSNRSMTVNFDVSSVSGRIVGSTSIEYAGGLPL